MKKVLFLIAFLFAVVCFAAPPPDESPVAIFADIGCQVAADVNLAVTPVVYEAQEVAYIYRGNTVVMDEAPLFAELNKEPEFPPVPVFTVNYSIASLKDDLPPPLRANVNQFYNYNRDLQFTNYGYPISMN